MTLATDRSGLRGVGPRQSGRNAGPADTRPDRRCMSRPRGVARRPRRNAPRATHHSHHPDTEGNQDLTL